MIICLCALKVLFNSCNAYALPYIFPNHALNWECSKDEQSFIWKLFSNEKGGESFYEKLYFFIYNVIPLIYFIETFC